MQTLKVKTGASYRNATPAEIAEASGFYAAQALNRARPSFEDPRAATIYLRAILGSLDYEVFAVLFLDNRHRLIACEQMFRGTIDGASVHPREVVKDALLKGAAAVILSHNHPSGIAEPSQADQLITARLRDALALIDVRILDHIIIGADKSYSFAQNGLL